MSFAYGTWRPATDEPIPTVVALHGHGAHGQDLLGLAPYLAAGRVLMVCPQAEFVLSSGALSYTWFNRPAGGQRSVDELERVAAALQMFIADAVPRCGGDPNRVVILGFSQGGTLAYRLGLGDLGRFVGVAALSTTFPEDIVPSVDRTAVADVALLVQHGIHDQTIDVERARASRDLLQTIGARPEYREYAMGHEISQQSLLDLSEWLARVFALA